MDAKEIEKFIGKKCKINYKNHKTKLISTAYGRIDSVENRFGNRNIFFWNEDNTFTYYIPNKEIISLEEVE